MRTSRPAPAAIPRRTMSVWRSTDGPREGGRRGRRTGSSGSSRKDRIGFLAAWHAAVSMTGAAVGMPAPGRSRTRETERGAEVRRPETSGTPTERMPAEPGPILGRYRLERRLGSGGFGVVWSAWDEKLEREVAVKAIPREGGAGERVEREARAAARLNHPGIVAIYELASDEHDVYLVSELVRGRTLAELTQAGAIADRDVARIGIALCEALEHAHARGVIHRDVKPQNVMVLAEPAAGAGFRSRAPATWSARSPTWRPSRRRARA